MAGMASPAIERRLVRSVGMGRRERLGVVLGSSPGSDRRLLPSPKPWPAQLGERRRALAQSLDCAWRRVAAPPRPGLVALTESPAAAAVKRSGECGQTRRRN